MSNKFYVMAPQFNRSGIGLTNMDVLFERPGVYRAGSIELAGRRNRGLPSLPEAPALIFDRKAGPPPDDIEAFAAWWVVSDRFKTFAEATDPGAFDFAPCDNTNLTIEGAPAKYWLCALARYGPFIDEEKSPRLKVTKDGENKQYVVLGGLTRIAVDAAKLGEHHVFGVPETLSVFCDHVFRNEFKRAGLRLRNFAAV
jgi:hypothetical protein